MVISLNVRSPGLNTLFAAQGREWRDMAWCCDSCVVVTSECPPRAGAVTAIASPHTRDLQGDSSSSNSCTSQTESSILMMIQWSVEVREGITYFGEVDVEERKVVWSCQLLVSLVNYGLFCLVSGNFLWLRKLSVLTFNVAIIILQWSKPQLCVIQTHVYAHDKH